MEIHEKKTICNTLNLREYDYPDSEMVSGNGGMKLVQGRGECWARAERSCATCGGGEQVVRVEKTFEQEDKDKRAQAREKKRWLSFSAQALEEAHICDC